MDETNTKTCLCGCGRKFEPKRAWQKYYDKECRMKAWHRNQTGGDIYIRLDDHERRIKNLEKGIIDMADLK